MVLYSMINFIANKTNIVIVTVFINSNNSFKSSIEPVGFAGKATKIHLIQD